MDELCVNSHSIINYFKEPLSIFFASTQLILLIFQQSIPVNPVLEKNKIKLSDMQLQCS